MKVVPRPGSLVTATSPPDCLANPNTWDRPRPVPLPTSLVVKNGSKMRATTSAGMPAPMSESETAAKGPGALAWPRMDGKRDAAVQPQGQRPLAVIASRAFTAMFTSAVSNW